MNVGNNNLYEGQMSDCIPHYVLRQASKVG